MIGGRKYFKPLFVKNRSLKMTKYRSKLLVQKRQTLSTMIDLGPLKSFKFQNRKREREREWERETDRKKKKKRKRERKK